MQPTHKRRLHVQVPSAKRVILGLVVLCGVAFFTAAVAIGFRYHIGPKTIWQFLHADTSALKKQENRINILLFGIGGASHDGGDLTDTIMLVSMNTLTHDMLMFSLPRDIWIPSLKEKINAAYRLGEEKSAGRGFVLAKAAVEEVLGVPIHYGVLLDFDGFKRIIDTLEGVDVQIAETFTDTQYPLAGKENDLCNGDQNYACRYETVTFTQGTEHMDGERALKYVRSRHGQGDAGTDFSRGIRQQALLRAVRQKIFTLNVVNEREKVFRLWNILRQSIKTDLSVSEGMLLVRGVSSSVTSIRGAALTQDIPEKNQKGLLINPPLWQYEGKWVLLPKHKDFTRIHSYVRCVLENKGQCEDLVE